jgi:hypothetical protein
MTRWFDMRGHLGAAVSILLVALALGPTTGRAQDDVEATRSASARALFSEGVNFADHNRWTEAADRFRRALAIRDSPVIAYNLASALAELGKLIEASELLRRIASNPEADAELRKSAAATLAEVTPRIARVAIHAEGRREGDRIALDEHVLLDAQLDVAVPIDPGVHLLAAHRGNEILDSRTFEVAESGSIVVTLQLARAPLPREVAVASAAPPNQDIVASSESDTPLTQQWWFWAGVGTVAVGAVVIGVLVASAGKSKSTTPQGNFDPPVLHVGAP